MSPLNSKAERETHLPIKTRSQLEVPPLEGFIKKRRLVMKS